MPLDRNWKRKRQVELQKKFICTALALIVTSESYLPFIEKKIISKDTYTTYMTNKLKKQIKRSSKLNDDEKDILLNDELLYDVCFSYYDTFMETEIPKRFKKLDIKTFSDSDLENKYLEKSVGYYTLRSPSTLHVRDYDEDKSSPYDFLKVISHEYAHLLQSSSKYAYIKESAAEIMSSEYYNIDISGYCEECIVLKILMEIIGSEPVWEATIIGDDSKLEKSIKELLTEEDANRLLALFKKVPSEFMDDDEKNNNSEIYKYLRQMYYNKNNSEMFADQLICSIYLEQDKNRLYFDTDRRTNPDKYEIYTVSLEDALSEGIIEEHYYEVYSDEDTNEKYKISISEDDVYDKILDGKMVVYDADSLVDGINVVFASKENVILEEDTSKISKKHEKKLIKATANN